jgi:sulfur carrier protein
LPQQSVSADALSMINARPPFAVAVNLNFVPKAQYAQHLLNENDQIEVIAPVTGG